MRNAVEVGDRLCELCRKGRNLDAVDELYADDVVSIEAVDSERLPRRMEGKEPVRGKNEWWFANHDVHRADVRGPLMHGDDRFAVVYEFDVTNRESGQRYQVSEVAVYTVEDGKVRQEEFFYTM